MKEIEHPLHGRIFVYWVGTNLSPIDTKIVVEKRFDKTLEYHKYRTAYINPIGERYCFGAWTHLDAAIKEQEVLIDSAEKLIRKKEESICNNVR